ncbi:hypothetical protein LMB49_10685 [Limosilactobacillus reuteri]|uniref:hypothetical protein n=1 Tax=Limosilactobacillus reuteri TaxID=1598 RepID=UPI001E438AC5|nr:hypothetical protein [Limosilactobacillus reuteri]MCC4370573.1 hypothetical protein [Limosilactobacillus reuteri]MCC4371858.1 hypothetical protein [Limosilactobacillus reuteri]MCC4509330.1 hypothetical protein [Limosilactobacillus reuteri]MCC4509373.1 hypothetical protein [Limosilactobacillus reuteri]
MTNNPFKKSVLEKIIDSNYPTETKVVEIMALYKTSRQQLLNEVRNELTGVIDTFKYERDN